MKEIKVRGQLKELVLSLDHYEDSFSCASQAERDSSIQKFKENYEMDKYPSIFDSDIPYLKRFLKTCLRQLEAMK